MVGNEQPGHVPVAPYTLAMVIADAVWRDPSTGKTTIIGCFTALHAREFPAVVQTIAVYIALTDTQGQVPIILRLVDADEVREPVFEATIQVEFKDRRTIGELVFNLANITFPEPGEYRFQLYCGPEPLMERRILVIDAAEK